VVTGRADPHHILPESGWVSFCLDEPVDVVQAIDLLRQSFELAVNQRTRHRSAVS
jgi:predicted DNA-binding protein (MmcQ/YjbR family)